MKKKHAVGFGVLALVGIAGAAILTKKLESIIDEVDWGDLSDILPSCFSVDNGDEES